MAFALAKHVPDRYIDEHLQISHRTTVLKQRVLDEVMCSKLKWQVHRDRMPFARRKHGTAKQKEPVRLCT